MTNSNICTHSNQCSLYHEKTDIKGKHLIIYKNVFCQRGIRGWKNCKIYFIFENQGHSKTK